MANVSMRTKKSRPGTFDKALPDMDCGYLRRVLPYDFVHEYIEEGHEYALFAIDGEFLISGLTAEDIYIELGEALAYCRIYLVH